VRRIATVWPGCDISAGPGGASRAPVTTGATIREPCSNREHFVDVSEAVTNDWAAVSMAINVGKPLCGGHADSRAGRDITALSRKLVPSESIETPVEAVPVKRPGRLRFFGKG